MGILSMWYKQRACAVISSEEVHTIIKALERSAETFSPDETFKVRDNACYARNSSGERIAQASGVILALIGVVAALGALLGVIEERRIERQYRSKDDVRDSVETQPSKSVEHTRGTGAVRARGAGEN